MGVYTTTDSRLNSHVKAKLSAGALRMFQVACRSDEHTMARGPVGSTEGLFSTTAVSWLTVEYNFAAGIPAWGKRGNALQPRPLRRSNSRRRQLRPVFPRIAMRHTSSGHAWPLSAAVTTPRPELAGGSSRLWPSFVAGAGLGHSSMEAAQEAGRGQELGGRLTRARSPA